ncbi:MAG: energy-coupled thiamine transporter ThiT [Johnsonella sp.]|nr:energy-coupled thiamine transporter ThiT [Johnsonella sp.]
MFNSETKSSAGKASAFNVRRLVVSAACIGLATVLSMIKVYEFPFGGSITAFSMLFICLTGYLYGLRHGLQCGLVYGILQFVLKPYIYSPIQVVVDYGLAFTALGLSGFFSEKKAGMSLGYILGVLGRYFFAVLSGYVFFAEYAWEGWGALPYSMAYNGAYIFLEALITLIILQLPPVRTAIAWIKQMKE